MKKFQWLLILSKIKFNLLDTDQIGSAPYLQ